VNFSKIARALPALMPGDIVAELDATRARVIDAFTVIGPEPAETRELEIATVLVWCVGAILRLRQRQTERWDRNK
jgi:hypothetical protein